MKTLKINKKIKRVLKNRIFIFILGGLLFGTIGVSAATYFASSDVTYDNSSSGLASHDVQGAIDELYNTCINPSNASDSLIDKVVTSGDGLYKDKYEDGRYIYRGTNPNNYINFNNETWRIISVERDGRIKILRNALLDEQRVWDTESSDTTTKSWDKPATLNTYLNNDYLNTILDSNKIFTSDWGIGTIDEDNNDLANQIVEENSKKWNGKIGLISVSEYLRASTNESQCGTLQLYNDAYNSCAQTNWMFISGKYFSVITPVEYYNSYYRQTRYVIPFVYVNGELHLFSANVNSGVRPALYLSSSVKITSGDGSQSNPYILG